jgi:site-specific recombinase XerD
MKWYVDWIVKFIRFHNLRHREEMRAKEVEQYLTFLAAKRQVSARTQKQALCALVFLYGTVLGRELGRVMPVRGRHGRRLPIVMTVSEVPLILDEIVGMEGMFRTMTELMYGSGTRRKETCRMRVLSSQIFGRVNRLLRSSRHVTCFVLLATGAC